jgi:FkbM family methyltransferase
MIRIATDESQWNTVSTLVDWMNTNEVYPTPLIVDIGANDGKRLSNSYNFIVDNGWDGILVEPLRSLTDRIKENYRGFSEYQVKILTYAVSDTSGKKKLYVGGEDHMLSSFVAPSAMSTTVECITPKQLFELYNIKEVGILSVDTEGHDFPHCQIFIERDTG